MTIEYIKEQSNKNTLLLAVLCAMLLLGIFYLHTYHIIKPITIPQAVEMQWASDTSWVNW